MQTEVRGVEISHDTIGSGQPLVWGHGLTSSREDELVPPVLIDWARVAEHVSLTRYDARGHGRSGYTADPDGYSWAELALDQQSLLDHLNLERVILGGASMGAGTALHTAVTAPERVAALVLVIPPTGWESRVAQADMYRQMAGIIDERGVELLIRAGAAVAPPDPFLDDPRYRERGAERLRAADPVRLAGVFRGASTARLPTRAQVATIEIPTFMLAWTGDQGHPVSTAETLAELMPDAELVVASTAADLETWTDRTIDFLTRPDVRPNR